MLVKFLFSFPFPIRKLLLMAYLGAIAYASLASPTRIPRVILFEHLDKVVHFIMYFGFCILAVYAFDKRKHYHGSMQHNKNIPTALYFLVIMMALAWGFSMELLQRYMAMGRQYSIYDMIANAVGAILGILVYSAIFRKI